VIRLIKDFWTEEEMDEDMMRIDLLRDEGVDA
jgi:hypothetical protein